MVDKDEEPFMPFEISVDANKGFYYFRRFIILIFFMSLLYQGAKFRKGTSRCEYRTGDRKFKIEIL